jgi:hypothetical protein
VVIVDWSEDDPGVAAQDEELESAAAEAVEEPAALATAVEPEVAAVWLAAMPAPRPRNRTALRAPATTRERAAGWRRRTGRRVPPRPVPGVVGGGLESISCSLPRVTGSS